MNRALFRLFYLLLEMDILSFSCMNRGLSQKNTVALERKRQLQEQVSF